MAQPLCVGQHGARPHRGLASLLTSEDGPVQHTHIVIGDEDQIATAHLDGGTLHPPLKRAKLPPAALRMLGCTTHRRRE